MAALVRSNNEMTFVTFGDTLVKYSSLLSVKHGRGEFILHVNSNILQNVTFFVAKNAYSHDVACCWK